MKLKGLFTDTTEQDTPEGFYRFAKNIVDSNTLLSKENEDGFLAVGELAPYITIGIIPIANDYVVFSTNNTNSEIGLVTKTGEQTYLYGMVLNDNDLEFSTAAPIKGEFRVDVNNQRVVAWIDDINVPRILNIDDPSSINDINDLALFQDIQNPSYSFTINDSGGSLKTGAIIPITKYQNSDGSTTNWFVHDQVIYINDDPKSSAFNDDDGSEGNLQSNKSVPLTFSGCDTRFNTLVVGYILIAAGLTTVYQVRSVTNTSTVNVTLTGSENVLDISLDEILTPTTSYNTAKAITQLSGRLYLGNLTAEELPSIQPYVNGIKINYTTDTRGIVPNNTGVHKDNLPPVLIPGEVYAFYLGIELNKGGWAFYPIPGREVSTTELDVLTNYGLTYTRFQIDDTSDILGADTNMGYWQNSGELYPDEPEYDGSSLGNYNVRNQPVRHHRMPSLDHLISTYYNADASVGVTSLPRILLDVTNVIIPADVQTKIKRWKIFYAKKTNSNSLFVGSDLLQFGVPQATDTTVRWGTGGNWAVEGEDGSGDWEDFNDPEPDTIRGHCLDFFIDSGLANPTYALFAYKLRCTNVNTQYTGFRGAGGKLTITGDDRGSNTAGVIDFTNISTTRSGGGFIKGLENFTYLPANALNGKFKTLFTEGVYVADINNPSTDFSSIDFDTLRTNSGGTPGDDNPWDGPIGGEDTMYMMYFRLLSDVHTSFEQQDLIPMTSYASPSTTSLSSVTGGDGWLCYMSYLACGPNDANPETTQTDPFEEGTRVWKAYVGYAKHNINYRYQTAGNPSTFYHGKTDVRSLFTPYVTVANVFHQISFKLDSAVNVVQYSDDYDRTNDFIVGTIWSTSLVEETNFPNTVIYSPVQNEDSKEFSWRTFLAADKHTTIKNKGVITNLQGYNNQQLLIHLERTLLRTRTDAEQAVDNEAVFLRSATIFTLPPEELVPSMQGYGGTQNKFSAVLTKAGYAYIDNIQGKVFLYNGSMLLEISTKGMRQFFRDFMQSTNVDNPFIGLGYTTGFDERFNRIIFSKKDGATSWTVSYNPITETWTSFHDYVPDYMFMTSDNTLHGLKDNTVYLMNPKPTSTAKGVYFDPTPVSSLIDVVHNEESNKDKDFSSVRWITEVYPSGITFGQLNTSLAYTSTCTHITLRSLQHCTGRLPLSVFSDIDTLYGSNIRILNRTWYFNDIRDIALGTDFLLGFYSNFAVDPTKLNTSMEWYDQRRFVDKYLVCRYEYDNLINNRFLFLESSIDYDYVAK